MASSIFGGIANAIDGGPKLNPVHYSSTLDDQLGLLTAGQAAQRAAQQVDLDRLNKAAIAAGGDIAKLSAGDQATIQSIIAQRQDPFATYQNVGNYNIGLLDSLSANLAKQGQSGESRRNAALGYGGRGPSTFQSNTLLDRVTQNLAPVYANTIGNIGRDASGIESARLNQNANVVDLMNYRAGIPLRSVDAYGIPLQARNAVNQADIQALISLGQGYKGNTAGFREKQTALGSIGGALDSVVDTGLSVYTGGLAGGSSGRTADSQYMGFGGGVAQGGGTGWGYPTGSGGSSPWGGFANMFGGAAASKPGDVGNKYTPNTPAGAWQPTWVG